jgi:TDG/mug DNA glycosylase family protein
VTHRVTEEWMGKQVETLADLLRPNLRAVCIGINPAPTSVAAGHYYQGKSGQRFYERLRRAGVLPRTPGWEDDLAFAHGIGFTDLVKRPTASAREVGPEELEHGRRRLLAKLDALSPQLLLFTFKEPARVLFGQFAGNGLISHLRFAGAPVFVMPGPYAAEAVTALRVRELAELLG